ncbi:DUF2971 domain-containing protein, partial [Salmonella enterica subsp. enterica serovar Montevideo]|nr:DUF2971 domain-containing protein [Salmonella enterica subsp. enterica serovar Montevideo]
RVCKYSDESIDCIILGYNSSPECYQEIRKIINDKKIILKKIERSNYGFKLYVGTDRY